MAKPSPLASLKFKLVAHRQWRKLLLCALKVCGNPSDAEDLVQETLEDVHQALPRLRSLDDNIIIKYLLMTMRNNFRSRCRRQRNEILQPGPYAVDPEQEQPEVAVEAWRRLDDEMLSRAEQALTERQRRVWAMRRSGKSYQEIGREMGIEPGAVGRLLFDARAKVRQVCLALMQV